MAAKAGAPTARAAHFTKRLGAVDEAQPVPFSSGSTSPKLKAPFNSCDCHMHIYDSRFPIASSARLRPPDASVDDYRRLQERLGTTRAVVVTPSTYGTDNRCTLAAIAKFGSSARGIAVVDTDVTRLELEQMAAAGIRGIRFNLKVDTTITSSMIEPLAGRIGDFGWHVQVNMRPDTLIASESLLNRLRVPIVFDHLAHIPPEPGIEHPAFRAVCRLIDKGNTCL